MQLVNLTDIDGIIRLHLDQKLDLFSDGLGHVKLHVTL